MSKLVRRSASCGTSRPKIPPKRPLLLDRRLPKRDTADMSATCIAGILAGGASKRLGSPKALLALPNGRTMLEQVAAAASPVAKEVVILGQPPRTPPSLASVPILPDAEPDRGPMGGLGTLLEYSAPHWGLLLACDLPALETSVLERLLQAATDHPQADAVAFGSRSDRDRYEPCCALYHPRIHQIVVGLLETGPTGLQALLRRVHTTVLTPSAQEARAFLDVDTIEDVAALGDLLG